MSFVVSAPVSLVYHGLHVLRLILGVSESMGGGLERKTLPHIATLPTVS